MFATILLEGGAPSLPGNQAALTEQRPPPASVSNPFNHNGTETQRTIDEEDPEPKPRSLPRIARMGTEGSPDPLAHARGHQKHVSGFSFQFFSVSAFSAGLEKTVDWYLTHREWAADITAGRYARERLGTA